MSRDIHKFLIILIKNYLEPCSKLHFGIVKFSFGK